MPATEYYARTCTVESDLCPARRRRGKRALLVWNSGTFVSGMAHISRRTRFLVQVVVLPVKYSRVGSGANMGPLR